MKIRQGFVSNSSSSSFICVLNDSNRHLASYRYKGEENIFGYYHNYFDKINNTLDTGLGRSTSICFGEDLLEYIKELDAYEYKEGTIENLSNALKQAIQDHGLENILFLRESDEGSGGFLPPELSTLTKQAIYEAEYH